MTVDRIIYLGYLVVWSTCIPLMPYTFFRHRKHFESIFALFIMLSIPILIGLRMEWVPGN